MSRYPNPAYLYTDFDGVLNKCDKTGAGVRGRFDPEHMAHYVWLIRELRGDGRRVLITLTSSISALASSMAEVHGAMLEAAEAVGWVEQDGRFPLHRRLTPVHTGEWRKKAILAHVKVEGPKYPWVAIDDLDLASSPGGIPREHMVRTLPYVGLTAMDADRALSILRRQYK